MSQDAPVEDDPTATVRRIFVLGAQRAGSVSALARHLGIHYSELKLYLNGEAMPPHEILLRAVDLVMEDLKTLNSSPEQVWPSLPLPASARRP